MISAIKKLEKMKLLKVNGENKNNRYYIKNIEDFLIGIDNNNSNNKDLNHGESLPSFNKNTIDNNQDDDFETYEIIDDTILENKIAKDMNC